MSPKFSCSDMMYEVKRSSSLWINEKRIISGKFSWQEVFGAFSYSKSQVSIIANYIEKQREHHERIPFVEEYKKLLELYGINYDDKYIFKSV